MKLLITTQAVDLDDPVLGFFHRWIEALSKRCESIHVICLKEGRHALPANVFVHSLGKESGASRVQYIARFYRFVWNVRREYDAVFVHMNSEYVVLGGLLWRAWGKRIVLWRNHKMPGLSTSIAAYVADVVCYTSPSAFVSKFTHAIKMPVGIDTEFFSPGSEPRKQGSILFLGRLDPVKKVEEFIQALEKLHEQGIGFSADIVGDPTDSNSVYARHVRELAKPLIDAGVLKMHPGVTQEGARDLYRSHAIYVNLTPSGSFDKTIGEAMACGAVVVASNVVLSHALPKELIAESGAIQDVVRAMQTALELSEGTKRDIGGTSRAYVIREHSLALLVDMLTSILRS